MEHAKAGYIVRLRFLRYHTSLWTGLLRIYRLDVQNRIGYQFICRNMESVGQYLCDIRIRTPPRGSWFYGGSRNCSRQPRSYLCGGDVYKRQASALILSVQPVMAETIWDRFSAIMRDVYGQLVAISTICLLYTSSSPPSCIQVSSRIRKPPLTRLWKSWILDIST